MYFMNMFKLSDTLLFIKRLSILLDSGVSLREVFLILSHMESSPTRKRFYISCRESIERGLSFSKSIEGTGVKFDPLLLTLIENGESSESLVSALRHAHVYLSKKHQLRKKIIGSLFYPICIMIATLLMTLFLILYIFPKIEPLLGSLNIQLPLITRIVQGIYHGLISYGLIVFVISLCLMGIFRILLKKIHSLRYRVHLLFLSIPYIRTYIQGYVMARLCLSSSMLLNSGRQGFFALSVFSDHSSHMVYKKITHDMSDSMIRGVSLYQACMNYEKYIPTLLIHMISIGEKTGTLADAFRYSGEMFESDIEDMTKLLSSLMEPLLMILMGLIVGSIALSIILPVYEITNHVGV